MKDACIATLPVVFDDEVEDLTEYFGPQLLFKLVQTRIQLITDAFALVGAVQSENSGDTEKLPFWAIEVCFLAYRLFVVVYRSEKVLQQVRHGFQPSWESVASV